MLKALEIVLRASQLNIVVGDWLQPRSRYGDVVWSGLERTDSERKRIEHALEVFTKHVPPELTSVQSSGGSKSISAMTASLVRSVTF